MAAEDRRDREGLSSPAAGPADGAAIDALLDRAEEARDRNDLDDGADAARRAWAAAADPAQRRRAGLLLVHFQYRGGELPKLVDTGIALLPLLRAEPASQTLFDLLRMVSLAACDTGRFDVALPLAQESQAVALQLGDRGRLALSINAIGCAFERMGDPWQAERLLREALEVAREHGERLPLFVTLNNLSAVLIGMYHLLRDAGPGDEGRDALRRALPLSREAHASVEPGEDFYAVFTGGNLGEALLHLGHLAEARPLLEEALARSRRIGSEAQGARLGYSLGELELLEGNVDRAWQILETVRLTAAGTELLMTKLRLHHALWRAASARGQLADALHHLESYLRLERQRALNQLRAQSQLFVSRAEADRVRDDSLRDALTRLANRREVERRWPQLLASARAQRVPVAVAMLDLDLFKQVNDRHGHAVGDAVLVALAGILRENTRGADLVARVGGEEFLLVLPDAPPARALEACERLRERVRAHDWQALAPGLTLSLSIGLTGSPPYDAHALTERADAALYRAKADGRDRVVKM